MVVVHLATSTSPRHVPLRLEFADAGDARRFVEAASRSGDVVSAYATNEAGAKLCGMVYRRKAPPAAAPVC